MKMKLSALLFITAIVLQLTACSTKVNDTANEAAKSTAISTADTASSSVKDFSSSESTSSESSSLANERSMPDTSSTSKTVSSKSVKNPSSAKTVSKSESAALKTATASKAVSSAAASKKSENKASSKAAVRSESSKAAAMVSSKAEPKKTESITTEIETPREENVSNQTTETPIVSEVTESSETMIVEEPVSSAPREWVDQHPPVETDKSTLSPEVAPYAYPYDLEAIRNEMIAYGESLGMHFDERLDQEDTSWATTTKSNFYHDWYTGEGFDPNHLREACLGEIQSEADFRYSSFGTPPDWLYFNPLLLPDDEHDGDFVVCVCWFVGDKFNYDEWYESIKDQL